MEAACLRGDRHVHEGRASRSSARSAPQHTLATGVEASRHSASSTPTRRPRTPAPRRAPKPPGGGGGAHAARSSSGSGSLVTVSRKRAIGRAAGDRAGVGDRALEAVAGAADAAEGRLEAEDAVQRGRRLDGSAFVAAAASGASPSATPTAEPVEERPRRALVVRLGHALVDAVADRRHAPLGEHGPAEEYGACSPEPRDNGGVARRGRLRAAGRAERRREALDVELVLDEQGHTVERAARPPPLGVGRSTRRRP